MTRAYLESLTSDYRGPRALGKGLCYRNQMLFILVPDGSIGLDPYESDFWLSGFDFEHADLIAAPRHLSVVAPEKCFLECGVHFNAIYHGQVVSSSTQFVILLRMRTVGTAQLRSHSHSYSLIMTSTKFELKMPKNREFLGGDLD